MGENFWRRRAHTRVEESGPPPRIDDYVAPPRREPTPTPAEQRRSEAEATLRRLRHRHWSADSLLDEGRTGTPWWEHPLADPFAVLGLLPGASLEEAAAIRRLVAAHCHPDVTDDRLAHRKMKAANAAYARIRDASLTAT